MCSPFYCRLPAFDLSLLRYLLLGCDRSFCSPVHFYNPVDSFSARYLCSYLLLPVWSGFRSPSAFLRSALLVILIDLPLRRILLYDRFHQKK